jgi:hypothetical protein
MYVKILLISGLLIYIPALVALEYCVPSGYGLEYLGWGFI